MHLICEVFPLLGKVDKIRKVTLWLHLCATLLTFFFIVHPAHAIGSEDSDAIGVTREFYKALSRGDCERAVALRPGYHRDRCREIRDTRIIEIRRAACDYPDTSIIYLDVAYKNGGQPARFQGFLMLRKEFGAWRIENDSYKSTNDSREYLHWLLAKGLLNRRKSTARVVDHVAPTDRTSRTASQSRSFEGKISPIPENVRQRMKKYSWREGCPVPVEDLSYITVTHYGYDGKIEHGALIVHTDVAAEVLQIFKDLFEHKFPIESVRLIDDFEGDDLASMKSNNTSLFNCRTVEHAPDTYSRHSYGMAIDINPLVNPYSRNGKVMPPEGAPYLDRSRSTQGMIHKGDACFSAFARNGWIWGGDWNSLKDYQHFEKRSKSPEKER